MKNETFTSGRLSITKKVLSLAFIALLASAAAQAQYTGIGTITPGSTLQVAGSFAGNYATVSTTPYTVGNTDYYIAYTGGANGTFTLPAGATGMLGRSYFIKNATTTKTLTINPAGTETIHGNSTVILNPGEMAEIMMQGTSGAGNSTSEVAAISIGSTSGGGNIGKPWETTGNGGTVATTSFIGTTDNVPLSFRVNGQTAGRIGTTSTNNTSIGYHTLNSTTGTENTAFGGNALASNTTGGLNAAFGAYALMNSTASIGQNSAFGAYALENNTTGVTNTAVGFGCAQNNTGSNGLTAVGYISLYNNSSGYDNSGFGAYTLYSNTSGAHNTATGYSALFGNTTGSYNTGYGESAMYKDSIGSSNTAVGYFSLYYNGAGNNNTAMGSSSMEFTTGGDNTALGYFALATNTTGTSNTALGYEADVSSAALSNATAIGASTSVNASNKVRIGNSSVTVIEGQVAYTFPSDGRFKKNVSQARVPGLDFIMKLKPVSYNFDYTGFSAFLHEKNADIPVLTKRGESRELGFIAQDIEELVKQMGVTFNAVHAPENDGDNYSVSYQHFVMPLVKAVQEQQEQIETLKAQNAELSAAIAKADAQSAEVAELKAAITEVRAELNKVVQK